MEEYSTPFESSIFFDFGNKINDFSGLLRAASGQPVHSRLLLHRPQFQNHRLFHQKLPTLPEKYRGPHSGLNEIDKAQKGTAQELNNFKMSTANTFSTMNEVLDSRGNISKGNTKAVEEGLEEVRKNVKELKMFITGSTRDINQHLEEKEREAEESHRKIGAKFEELLLHQNSQQIRL